MNKTPGIYCITNTITNKVYVGSTVNLHRRCVAHLRTLRANKHHSAKLQRAWNKYGEEAFKFEIIEYVTDISKLDEREQYWIDYYDAANPKKGYNINPKAESWSG